MVTNCVVLNILVHVSGEEMDAYPLDTGQGMVLSQYECSEGRPGAPRTNQCLVVSYLFHLSHSGQAVVVSRYGGFTCIFLIHEVDHLFIFVGLALLTSFSEKCQFKLMADFFTCVLSFAF